MAWISVHDTIDGPKLRDLHKRLGISKFEATGILVFLWQWGLQNADEHGLLISTDREDVERFLQGASSGCAAPASRIYDALLESGWIDDVEGSLYLHDWEIWQKEWYKYKTKLKKDSERKRKIARMSAGKSAETEKENPEEVLKENPKEIPTENPPETEKEIPAKKQKRSKIDYTDEFNRLWDCYPRNDRKAEAFECFLARIKNGVNPEDMINASQAYADKCRRERTPAKYIMQARTFLGVHLNFMDYVPKETEKKTGSPGSNPFDQFVEG